MLHFRKSLRVLDRPSYVAFQPKYEDSLHVFLQNVGFWVRVPTTELEKLF